MKNIRFSLFCLFALISPVQLGNPHCSGNYNTNPIVRDEPTFINSVPNGKRFVVGSGYDKINIVHVYGGTPYDMGFAFGSLMKKELNELLPEYFAYLDKTIEDALKIVPAVNKFFFICFVLFFIFLVCCKMDCGIRFTRCS
jgi:hypothetical protein